MRFEVFATLLVVACSIYLEVSGPQTIEQVQLTMQTGSTDSAVQLQACNDLQHLSFTQSSGPYMPGEWGGWQVSTELLENGIGEALAQGLLNSVTIDVAEGKTGPSQASSTCLNTIVGLAIQNNYEKGLALINNSPHLWKAIVGFFRAFKGNRTADLRLCTLAALYGTPQPAAASAGLVAEGGIDLVMEYLENVSLKSDPEMQQTVWCALSDPVHEQSGVAARAIVNYGGPLKGIPILIQAHNVSLESGTFLSKSGHGLHFEIAHVEGGVLEHDDETKSYANGYVQAGILPGIVPLMEKEPGDNELQHQACHLIKLITDDNIAVQNELAEQGAIEVMAKALVHFSQPRFDSKDVVFECSAALLHFAVSNPVWQKKMLSFGIADKFEDRSWQHFFETATFTN